MGAAFAFSINMLIFFCIIVGGILLQIFLSKRENKWPGLILPFLTFCISLLAIFSIAAFSITSGEATLRQFDENGILISETVEKAEKQPIGDTASVIAMTVMVFLLYNIPTGILLAIYAACREKKKRNLELEKMSVQDLE